MAEGTGMNTFYDYPLDFSKPFTLREIKGEPLSHKEMDNNLAMLIAYIESFGRIVGKLAEIIAGNDGLTMNNPDANGDGAITVGEFIQAYNEASNNLDEMARNRLMEAVDYILQNKYGLTPNTEDSEG